MKNITFFPTLHEYQHYIHENIIKTGIFKYDLFYRGLIDFIIDHRAPLFFEATEDYEYSHFTQYFNFVLRRGDYKNDFVQDMFFMHDFVHMIFDNPINVRSYSFDYFSEIVNVNEWVASNETETMTYYRVPELRELSLEYTIMYDLLRHAGHDTMPSHASMLDLRKKIVFEEMDCGLGGHPDAEKVFTYLRKFKENNGLWCQLWYDHFPKVEMPYFKKRLCLPLDSYDDILINYHPRNSEAMYQNNVLLNVQTGLALLGETSLPAAFAGCEDAVRFMEGKVIMPEVAQEFHTLYMKNKFK